MNCQKLLIIFCPSGKYDEAQKSISELNRSTKDQQDLITQLEKDLVSVHGYERGEGEGQAAPSADAELVNKVLMELAEEEGEMLTL